MEKQISGLSKKLTDMLKGKNKYNIIFILGLVGIGLIFLSQFFGSTAKANTTSQNLSVDTAAYKQEIENDLANTLSSIKGVGNVKVMLTIEGSVENVYAQEENTKNEQSSDKTSQSYQNKYVIVDKGNQKEALVKKVLKPKINGVIVVCEGGNSPVICEQVYKAVSTVLDISAGKICVVKG